jgi:hypothetical protein
MLNRRGPLSKAVRRALGLTQCVAPELGIWRRSLVKARQCFHLEYRWLLVDIAELHRGRGPILHRPRSPHQGLLHCHSDGAVIVDNCSHHDPGQTLFGPFYLHCTLETGSLLMPVILPKRRPESHHRGFVRAYTPVLEGSGIDQTTWLDFLDGFEKSIKLNP